MINQKAFFKRILSFVAKYPAKSNYLQTSLSNTVIVYELNSVPENIDALLDSTYKSSFAQYKLIKVQDKYAVVIKYSPNKLKEIRKNMHK